jgi:hypothetical protein
MVPSTTMMNTDAHSTARISHGERRAEEVSGMWFAFRWRVEKM